MAVILVTERIVVLDTSYQLLRAQLGARFTLPSKRGFCGYMASVVEFKRPIRLFLTVVGFGEFIFTNPQLVQLIGV